jgi:glycosyltransferase involved in cell wall biosynthesis
MTATSHTPHVLMIAPGPFFVDRGFGVSVYEQARALQRRGARVEVVCYPSGRDVPDVRTHRAWPLPGYDASRIGPSLTRLPLWALLLVKAWLVARRTKPDVLHGHLHEGALIAAIVSRLTGVPWLFDFQGSLSLEMAEKRALREGSLPFRLVSMLEGWIDRRAPLVLVRSAAMQRDLAERFGVEPKRIVRVMDGADPDVFCPRQRDGGLRAQLGLPDDSTVIGYIGLLTEQQGTERLLRAAQIVAREQSDCHVLIMGYPVDEAKRLARELDIESRVTFTGRVDYADTPNYLALIDLAVAPKVSRTEGNGKLYNYAGMALPVVAIDSDVNREVLGDDAYYATGETPEEFAHAIENALADRAGWAERGRRLRARLEAEFTWDAVAERLMEAYRAVTPERFEHV